MDTDRIIEDETMETDIVVVGGGGAGLTAAVAAAEKGAKVILLEKRALGGNSALAQGFFAAESPLQKAMNLSVTRDETFRTAMEYSHWRINPRILRAFINKSGDTIRWLEEMGLSFEEIRNVYGGSFRTMHCLSAPNRGGVDIIKALLQTGEKLGVEIFTRCPVKEILTDESGGVTGVLATTKGKRLRINAKSVVIATGGYGGSKKLLKKYYPTYSEHMIYVGAPNTGDGILMATRIGAATEGLGTLMLHHHIYPGSRNVNMMVRSPSALWVNKRGERFTDETVSLRSTECGNVLDRQPDKCVYVLLDQKIKDSNIEETLGRAGSQRTGAYRGVNLDNLDKDIQSEADKGGIKISDSWDEIARWMEVAPEVLNSTVEEYNFFCDQGYDEIYVKDRNYLQALRTPPYYAVRCYMHWLTTIGGIKINHKMEVLNNQDNPIPGLYAGGDTTGGWEYDTYCMVLAGSGLGFALNSGRIAGENAADFVGVK